MRHKLSIVAVLLLTACAPKFGDSCERSLDCSANGERMCDLAQPGGYCTVQNCEPGDCGRDDYVCRAADGVNTQIMDRDVSGKFCVVQE